jgi:hypothetical protein
VIPYSILLVQGLKVCDSRSALFLLKATKEFKEKSSTLARSLVERMGLPESSLALPWDTPVYRSGRLEWDLGGMRFPPKSTRTFMFSKSPFNLRFSLADLSLSSAACCPKSLANASRYHSDALAASMIGRIIVPLCSSIDVFGFRIMCTGPVDNLQRRVLVGRDVRQPLADLLDAHGAAAAESESSCDAWVSAGLATRRSL